MNSSTERRFPAILWIASLVGVVALTVGAVAVLRHPRPSPPSSTASSDDSAAMPPVTVGTNLKDVTDTSGITFRHCDGGAAGQKYLVEAVSAGLALFDYDGDGLIDIYFVSGAPLPPADSDSTVTNALYRNEGDMRFRDVTFKAGVGDPSFGLGVAVGDYDSDGDADLYVNNFGPNVLYRNNGNGTFTGVSEEAGVACGNKVGAGVCFLDSDGDGHLDLYVTNYIDFDFSNHVERTIDGFPCYPGPLDFEPVADVLYRNNGDGTFTDVSESSGIGRMAGAGMGMVCADYDNDRDTDIYVANDEMGNYLFENNGEGVFEEVGLARGLAYNFEGRALGSMGIDCADYDNDGWLDFFTTCYCREAPVLYRNLAGGLFEDVTLACSAGTGATPHVNWGTGFADFDSDGDRDLIVACGHLDEEVHRWDLGTAYRLRNLLLMNAGDGTFVDVSDRCGDGLMALESSRGIGLDDLDNDGDIDVVILNIDAAPTILRNDTESDARWVEVEVEGVTSNRDGAGAQVRVTAGGRTQLAEVHCGRGYQSHHGQRLHFGLGDADRVERIEVRWIGGGADVFEDLAANQRIRLVEGQSPAATSAESTGTKD